MADMRCIGCNKTPSEIAEYVGAAHDESMTPEAYVREEEGTYNPATGRFACTDCYCNMGMPSLPASTGGWKAP